jgi:membrane glycosyltransferase
MFGAFWYDFIIGDDWRLAVGVVAGLGLSALVVHHSHVAAWWLLPLVVIIMLTVSLSVGTRRKDK